MSKITLIEQLKLEKQECIDWHSFKYKDYPGASEEYRKEFNYVPESERVKKYVPYLVFNNARIYYDIGNIKSYKKGRCQESCPSNILNIIIEEISKRLPDIISFSINNRIEKINEQLIKIKEEAQKELDEIYSENKSFQDKESIKNWYEKITNTE